MSIKFKGLKLNEEVTIPPELANAYLSVKKQIVDKQTKKDNLMKSVNQVDNEINILTKNLIAIETKAATAQGEQEQQDQKVAQQQKDLQAAAVTGGVANESLDEQWAKLIESMAEEETDLDVFADDVDDEAMLIDEPLEVEPGESLEGDYVFTLLIEDENGEEDIIAKFYKNEDDDYWRVRVVQGDEEPLESMQFDPELEMVDIIEKIAEIPGYTAVEEMETQEYEDLLDDKEIIDNAFYDDIIKEE